MSPARRLRPIPRLRRAVSARLGQAALLFGLVCGVVGLVWAASQTGPAAGLRERVFDAALARSPAAANLSLPVFVAIDRKTIARAGPWPWPRDRLAGLLSALTAAAPRAIALDILLEGPDQSSPAALARRLDQAAPDPALTELAQRLPDGDAALAAALARAPAALGLAMDPSRARPPPPLAPMLARSPVRIDGMWDAQGLIAPGARLSAAAQGLGVLSLPGDSDAVVRRAPLLVVGGDILAPGLAVELLRLTLGGAPVLVDGPAEVLRLPGRDVALGDTSMLRLVPLSPAAAARATLSAEAVLTADPQAMARLTDAVVVLGAAAPELGGLRPGPGGRLVPSALLQALAFAQLQAGLIPRRPAWTGWAEPLAAFAVSLLAGIAALHLPPWAGAAAVTALVLAGAGAAFMAISRSLILVDPLAPAISAALVFALAALWVAARSRRQAARIRSAFEQHLAPDVVHRIAETPGALRLAGERREITALFSDIEGFTAMTERAAPEALIALLDRYFDGMARIVVAHGGMIDKIVGDAIHAFFNLPLDLPGHPQAALDCAYEMTGFAQRLGSSPAAQALGMGRTRIGIETGPVIAGNVGGARKLDYTAHGPAVNAAARLEAANKQIGSAVLLGPVAAAAVSPEALMPLGPHSLRGFSMPLALATPWPEALDAETRAAWRSAVVGQDVATLAAIAHAHADLTVLAETARRLGARTGDA
ncbi:MAG: adenylate/guanylate cyclase domain-containing protein [Pseudomonadota bacterium]